MQLVFDYNRVENNPESTKILRDNVKHFSRQCEILLEAFRRGEVLTVVDMVVRYKVGDPRARIRDLRDGGIDVKDELVSGRFKKYFL